MPVQVSEIVFRKLFIRVLALVFAASFWAFDCWTEALRDGASAARYMPLPSFFIYHDLGKYERSAAALRAVDHDAAAGFEKNLAVSADEKRGIRAPVGESLLVAPFFIVAHLYCFITGEYAGDGFSAPYLLLAGLAGIFYILLGFRSLYLVLRRYFGRWVTVFTLCCLAFATDVFYYGTCRPLAPQAFEFALGAFVLHRTVMFWENPDRVRAAWLGVVTGLAMLLRVQDVILVFVPLLWGLTRADVRARAAFFVKNRQQTAFFIAFFALAAFLQCWYVRRETGHWGLQVGGEASFHLSLSGLFQGLFGYRNGWLPYTPVAVLALAGLVFSGRFNKAFWAPLLVLLPLRLVLFYSFPDVFEQTRFGDRPMILLYAVLALPLAALIGTAFQQQIFKTAAFIVFFGLSYQNILQTWQVDQSILYPTEANGEHFWAVFGLRAHNESTRIAQETQELQPGRPETMIFVKNLMNNGLEDSTGLQFSPSLKHGGRFALQMADQEFGGTVESSLEKPAGPGHWLRVSVWAYAPRADKQPDISKQAMLVLVLSDKDGNMLKYRQMRIAEKIGRTGKEAGFSGATDLWGEAVLYVKMPDNFPPEGRVKAYVWNPAREHILIDDLGVELRRTP